MGDPTPRTLHRTAAAEFGDSWRSPGVQRYLGAGFESPVPGGAPAPSPSGAASPSAEARLQQVLTSIQCKEVTAWPSGLGRNLGGNDSNSTDNSAAAAIAAYRGAPTTAAPPAAAATPAMGDALSADYRDQLQRYAQQLAAKDAEAAALRLHVGELKQQLVAAEGRAARADDAAARRDAAAGQLEAQAATLERQLAEREAELAAAAAGRRAAEQAAAAARAAATAAQKAAGGREDQRETDRRYFQEQLERRDAELHRCRLGVALEAGRLKRGVGGRVCVWWLPALHCTSQPAFNPHLTNASITYPTTHPPQPRGCAAQAGG